jgi:hypothetical protein
MSTFPDKWAGGLVEGFVDQNLTTGQMRDRIEDMYKRMQIPATVRDIAMARIS